MKTTNVSFLFFFIYIACFFINSNVYGQQALDSSYYYREILKNPKGSNDLISAYIFFDKHKKESLKNSDTLKVIYDLRYIASIENALGLPYESENSIVKALQLLDTFKDSSEVTTESRIGIYNHLGIIYRSLNDYEKALEFYDKVLEIAKDPRQINKVYNNKGNIYKDLHQYKLAVIAYAKVYEERKKNGNIKLIAKALDNLGFVQSKLNQSDGFANLTKALTMREQIQDISGLYLSYRNLSEYYNDRNDKSKSLHYANKGYLIAKQINSASYIDDALSHIFDINENKKIIEFIVIRDSLSAIKQKSKNKYAASKYEYSQYLKKAQESELQKEKEKRLKIIYKFIGMFIVLLAISLYIILRIRHKKEKIQQVYNTETRISEKVHDEVANGLYHVMTKLQSKNKTNDEVLDDLEGIYNKTRDISKENSSVDIKANYNELLHDLLLSYKTNDINVVTRNISKVNWDTISDIRKTTLYRVLQELMTNMRKHSKASIVALTFNQTKNKIAIDYKDNGVGCKLKKNTGLLNTENRMASINGTITFESQPDNGFKAKIIV
ncbi:tetratricopeptide repeat-containing sensor histidine kinase [Jejuia spongiicola]|uniref:histidine kinase n=1 Tax=Jejuia spongiicola TaxID=2942207 RepID=A0ABT0QH08_9FLAO|nr:tetratricopeptide repeat-containing sensor histidine kinase [Jejuia spongiicola]MCL6296279.1 tetratricopeptide repeat protein [Jejuia spongiicola]